MAKKKEIIEAVQDESLKETKEVKFKMKDYRSEIDKYIKEKIESESKKQINIKDYKDQIDKYVKERVEIESASQSVKLLKKQLHSKKVASAIKSFIILCLLGCIGYGVYYLYDDGYFEENKGVKCPAVGTSQTKPNDDPNVKTEPVETKLSLDELKSKYGYLLDNVIFDANSNYTRDFYNGNLTNEIKLYLSYKLIDSDYIQKDEESSYFESSVIENAYKKIFNDNNIKLASFKYNNASYIYLSAKEMFMSSSQPNEVKDITREIIDITLDEHDNVTVTTVEGYVSESGKLYNILNNKEISGYKSTDSLSKYKDKLNIVKYVFNDEYLISLNK